MESVPRLFAYILGLNLVFISLVWGWIRCALSLMRNIRDGDLEHPNVWRRVLNVVPWITISILVGVFLCSILCLSECLHERTSLIICVGFLFVLNVLIGGTFFTIWKSIFVELVIIFDRSGS